MWATIKLSRQRTGLLQPQQPPQWQLQQLAANFRDMTISMTTMMSPASRQAWPDQDQGAIAKSPALGWH